MLTVQNTYEAEIDAWVEAQISASPELGGAQLAALWSILGDSTSE
jgi:hypothetical protein